MQVRTLPSPVHLELSVAKTIQVTLSLQEASLVGDLHRLSREGNRGMILRWMQGRELTVVTARGYIVTIIVTVHHGLLNARGCYLFALIQLRGSTYSMSGCSSGQKVTEQIPTSIFYAGPGPGGEECNA